MIQHECRASRFTTLARYVMLLTIAMSHSCAGSTQGPSAKTSDSLDQALFEKVVARLSTDTQQPELRIDPRPLHNDPRLVSLRGVSKVVPDLVPSTTDSTPTTAIDGPVVRHRRDVLKRLGIPEADALSGLSCPGVTIPPSDSVDRWRARECPQTSYRVAMIAVARRGGVLWPGTVNELERYGTKVVYSVRVIETILSRQGSIERAMDYVFEDVGSRAWRFLERRELLIIE